MQYWPLQDAKARLSQLIKITLKEGLQGISVRGQKEVIILSRQAYEKLQREKPNFLDFIQHSPLKGIELNLERDQSLPRELEL